MKRRKAGLSAVFVAVATLSAACTGSSSNGNAQVTGSASTSTSASAASSSGSTSTGGTTLNVYLYQKPKAFSPLEGFNGPDRQIMDLIFEPLVNVDNNDKFVAGAAKTWDVSSDGTTYTFHLRQGLKWSDGQPFSSDDVLFTFNLLANPKASAHSGSFAEVAGASDLASGAATTASGFSAPDPNTFVIKLSAPDFGFLAKISGAQSFILPKHVLGNVSPDQIQQNPFFLHPSASLGPFEFVDYKADQYVEVKKNPNYWGSVGIDTMYLRNETSDVATAQLQTGEMDLVNISATDAARVKKLPNVQVESAKGTGIVLIAPNISKPYLQDPRVREAFLYAINRKSIVANVLQGFGYAPNTQMLSLNDASGVTSYGYDPAKAKALLKAAGWDSSRTLTLEWIPGQRDRDTAVTAVQSDLAAVGVKVKLEQVQVGQILNDYKSKTYDLALYGGGLYTLDPSSVGPALACNQFYPTGGNIPFFCDQQIDKLMTQAEATSDAAQRGNLYTQANDLISQQVPYIWLYVPDTIWAFTSKLHGFQPTGMIENGFWNAADWTLS